MLGRTTESAALAAALREHSMVAVTGPAGVGKTTLAQAAAPLAVSVSLTGVRPLRDVLEHVARALGRTRPVVRDQDVAAELARIIEGQTVILDDADEVEALDTLVGTTLRGRLIVVTRQPTIAGVPQIAVGPLDDASMRSLLRELEAAQGRTVHEELLTRAGGNPLSLQLILVAGVVDLSHALVQSIAALDAPARRLLTVLVAARRRFFRAELASIVPALDEALTALRARLLLTEESGQIGVSLRVIDAAAPLLGPPDADACAALAALADRALDAMPDDADALTLACRARLHARDVAGAVAQLERRQQALASLPTSSLEALVRELAATAPEQAAALKLVLARQQLRGGDVARACRLLDSIVTDDSELSRQLHLLRGEALLRSGDPGAAAQALSSAIQMAPDGEDFVALATAGFAAIRGELTQARAALRALAPRGKLIPAVEAQRAATMALTYILDERYARGVVWTRRAQRAFTRSEAPSITPFVVMAEVLALLEVDRLDEAAAALQRVPAANRGSRLEPLGRDVGLLLEEALLARRGQHAAALPMLEAVLAALDERADRVPRAVVARYLARTCTALGQFDRAENYLRICAGVANEPGYQSLAPVCEREWALLEEARGRIDEARRRLESAHTMAPTNPLVAIDRWALDPEDRPAPRVATAMPSVAAWAALRGAERALDRRDAVTAHASAVAAERLYDAAGARAEALRAQVARAEALVHLGRTAEAEALLGACEPVARQLQLQPLVVELSLVRAATAAREGRVDVLARALGQARSASSAPDPAVEAAHERLGLDAESVTAPWSPAARRMARLGLQRTYTHFLMIGERVWLQAAGDPAPTELDAIVDLDGAVVIARERMPWSGTRLALLGRLVDAGPAGMSLEEMYLQVWQGRAYQALEHRNMVYVTLQRVRSALKRLLGDEPLEHIDDARYALTARFRLGVRRPVDREWLRRFIVRRTREVVAPRSPALRPLGRSTAIES